MAKKKKTSRSRSIGKKIIIALNILVSVLIIYPIVFTSLGFIWVNGFLGLIMPYLLVIELLFLIFWLIAKPILSLISVISLIVGWSFVFTIIGFHPGLTFPKNKKENTLRIISWNVRGFNGLQNNSSLKFAPKKLLIPC